MNEASYRAHFGFLSDDALTNEVAINTENAAHGRKMLAERECEAARREAERAEAKRQAEEAARIKPGDIVRYRHGSNERYLVTSPAVTRIVTEHYGFDRDWITTINMSTGVSSSDHPRAFEKAA